MSYKKFKLFVVILIFIVVCIMALILFVLPEKKSGGIISSFEDCINTGNAIIESYPRKCEVDGLFFIEEIGNAIEKADIIRVMSPQPNQILTSPLTVIGEARGNWFFEASFPVVLLDDNDNIIFQSYIMTSSNWMTTDFVPFEAMFTFDIHDDIRGHKGVLLLQKDNPSEIPEYNDELRIPIVF